MEFLSSLKGWKRYILPVLLGSAAGFAYYYYVGCITGTCPLSSNPYIMTAYGALMGALLVPKSKKQEPPEVKQI